MEVGLAQTELKGGSEHGAAERVLRRRLANYGTRCLHTASGGPFKSIQQRVALGTERLISAEARNGDVE